MAQLVQCVPNFSEGRDTATIEAIVGAVRDTSGVRLADWSADVDHNRMVVTFVGPPEAVLDAALAAASEAVKRIDLRSHDGVHPRLGALDVLPFVPLTNISLGECADVAKRAAEKIGRELSVPVFLYEASSADFRSLPNVRKDAFVLLAPDYGPLEPHPSAGAVVCGARGPLIAFNVNLRSQDIQVAKRIALEVRTAFGGSIRALGLDLSSRNMTQVSMNIVNPREVSLPDLILFIAERAEVVESELIGALPGYTAFETIRGALRLTDLKPGQVLLENWDEHWTAT